MALSRTLQQPHGFSPRGNLEHCLQPIFPARTLSIKQVCPPSRPSFSIAHFWSGLLFRQDAKMSTPTTCACTCDNSESALSTTANIISIVTLAYVLLIGVGYRIAAYRTASIRSTGLYADAAALRTKLDTITAMNSEKPTPDDDDLRSILERANSRLQAVEQYLSLGLTGDKWSLIWSQLQQARKRDEWAASLAEIKAQVEFYVNYQYGCWSFSLRTVLTVPGLWRCW